MEITKRGLVRPTVVRTLGLPRDFQIYLEGTRYAAGVYTRGPRYGEVRWLRAPEVAVRKASTDKPFIIRSRVAPGWRLFVRCVKHTHRALVKWVLWRYRKYVEGLLPVSESLGGQESLLPLAKPLISTLVAVLSFFLCLFRALRRVPWLLWVGIDWVLETAYQNC